MRLNSAFVLMVVIVDRHFGNETVMVYHNLTIEDDSEDGVLVAHDDMRVMWMVDYQFLHTCKKHNFTFRIIWSSIMMETKMFYVEKVNKQVSGLKKKKVKCTM